MKANDLNKLTSSFNYTDKMPVLFLGHGSPMNAIVDNEFVRSFQAIGEEIPAPNAVLCISAHWETRGTMITAMDMPPTIHDFGGFPQALFDVQYPAPGSPELASEIKNMVTKTEIGLDDHQWGLDHGAWSVIRNMYPKANVPVIQMSLDYNLTPQYHYELAKELAALRKKGVLVVGSGNLVHNLRMIAWDKFNVDGFGFDWAIEANERMKDYILTGNHQALIDFGKQGKAFDLAIPTPDHYLPLLYALALKENDEELNIFNDKAVAGSLMMTSVKIG